MEWDDEEKTRNEKRQDFEQWSLSPLSPPNTHSGETQSKKLLEMKPHYKWNHSGVSVSQHGGPGFMKGT